MKTLSLQASDEEVLSAVREWVGLLIEERYAEAYEFLFNAGTSHTWTPELIATVIHNYGSPIPLEEGEDFKVTPLEDAIVESPRRVQPRHDVHRYQDGKPDGYVLFDFPLNGYWSDLTAILELRVVDYQLVLELTEIEVM